MRFLTIIMFLSFLGASTILFGQSSDKEKVEYVSFTLRNGSLKDIPLLIPGVMNPNLTSMGNSGVTLKVGQEVLFKYKAKKRILLVVDKSLEGQTLEVQKLIKKRKEEIDLETNR